MRGPFWHKLFKVRVLLFFPFISDRQENFTTSSESEIRSCGGWFGAHGGGAS